MKESVKEIETAKAYFIQLWSNIFINIEKKVTANREITSLTNHA